MSEWRQSTLGEFVSLQRGHDLTEAEQKPGIVPVMGSAGQNGYHNTALAKGPGIVIGRSGASFGQVHYCSVDYWPHNTTLYVTDFHGNDPRFSFYFLKNINFARYNSGSAQPSLNRNFIYPIEVKIPYVEEQRAIAHILGTLDDKIELNRRMNETLEAIARAMFKSWFVDFDPVRAKMSGEPPESICQRLGLTPDLLALFPDRLVDSELGEIPEGWEAKPFGELLSKTIGGDWGTDQQDEKHSVEVRIIRGTDMPKIKSGVSDQVPRRFVQESKFNSRKLQMEDLVMEVSGGSPDQPTGRALRVTQRIIESLNGNVVPASFCRLFRPIDPKMGPMLSLHLDLIYDAGKTWEYQNQSTGISNLQTTYFLERELVVSPSYAVRNAFYARVEPLLVGQYLKESTMLADIRNALLPKLLSGDLRVPVEVE